MLNSAMIAVALDNFSVVIVDLESKKIVRVFDDHNGSISGMVCKCSKVNFTLNYLQIIPL